MARRVSPLRPLLLPLLFLFSLSLLSLPARGQTPADQKRTKRLQKKLQTAEQRLARARKQIESKKNACRSEYAKLSQPRSKQELAGMLDAVRARYVESMSAQGRLKAKAQRQLTRDVRSALGQSIGPVIASYLAQPLGDELSGSMVAADYSSLKVVKNCLEDSFSGDFEQDFKTEISKHISRSLPRLLAEHDKAKHDLEAHLASIKARVAGLPFGMTRVQGGTYNIGVDRKQLEKLSKLVDYPLHTMVLCFRSAPAHRMKLNSFLIDQNEVTCAAYAAFLKDTGSKSIPRYWLHKNWGNREQAKKDPQGWSIPEGWESRPVTGINYEAALTFCRWVGRRLPSEFEWEAAARFGQDKKQAFFWSWGDTPPKHDRCNYDVMFDIDGRRRGLPWIKVKAIPPVVSIDTFPEGRNQALGLNDMCGNAYEFTSSPFVKYPGFKAVNLKGRTVNGANFNAYEVVIRGGCGSNRAPITSTFWRLGIPKTTIASYVGFRTAASTIKGKDHLDAIFESGEYKRFLARYEALLSDTMAGRDHAVLALDDPARYSALMAGGWNEKTRLPERARFISILNRKANDFTRIEALNGMVGVNGEPVLLGFLHTDAVFKKPMLVPGDYLVLWMPHHEEPIDEPEAAGPKKPGTGEKPAGGAKPVSGKKSGKKAGKKGAKGKKQEKVKTIKVPDAVWFYNVHRSKSAIVKFSMGGHPPTVSVAQPTIIRNHAEGNGVDLVYSFPVKHKRKKSFVVTIELEAPAGVTKEYK